MPIVIHNHWIDKLAVFTGIVSGFALYPQIYTLMASGTTENVSIVTFVIILANSVVWLMYSIHRGLLSLAIPSILNIFASGGVIIWYFSV
jgi:uncharacterized protein with PQ loop repeat